MAVARAMRPLNANVSSTPPGPASRMLIPVPMNTPAPIIMPTPIIVMWNSDSSRDSPVCTSGRLPAISQLPFDLAQ